MSEAEVPKETPAEEVPEKKLEVNAEQFRQSLPWSSLIKNPKNSSFKKLKFSG